MNKDTQMNFISQKYNNSTLIIHKIPEGITITGIIFTFLISLVFLDNFANLISKLNFYKLIPYPMDNSLSGRRRPARQTSEKDVLCFH